MAQKPTDVVPAASEAFELADFETPVSTLPVPNVVWSIEKHTVAQMLALEGKSKARISRETGVPVGTITKWQQHGEFRDYINQLVLEQVAVLKARKLQDLLKTLAAREAAAEAADDWAGFSKADSLDILAAIRKETGEEERREDSRYSQVLEKLLEKIPDPPKQHTIDITPAEGQ